MNMKPGRNDPCSCGSGKKFRLCCEGTAASLPPAPAPDELKQLVSMFRAGRHAELESRARSMLGQYPESGFAWKLLGASLQAQGKDALQAFQKTAGLMPNDPEVQLNLGVAQKNIGKLDDAEASYRRALKLDPDYAEAHNNLGLVLKDLGQLDGAVASYRRALEIKPDFADAHGSIGSALKELGQFEGAIASYRRALELKPDYADAYSCLLFLYAYQASLDPLEYLALARGWEQACLPAQDHQAARNRVFRRPPLAGSRLRGGYVSGVFRQ